MSLKLFGSEKLKEIRGLYSKHQSSLCECWITTSMSPKYLWLLFTMWIWFIYVPQIWTKLLLTPTDELQQLNMHLKCKMLCWGEDSANKNILLRVESDWSPLTGTFTQYVKVFCGKTNFIRSKRLQSHYASRRLDKLRTQPPPLIKPGFHLKVDSRPAEKGNAHLSGKFRSYAGKQSSYTSE